METHDYAKSQSLLYNFGSLTKIQNAIFGHCDSLGIKIINPISIKISEFQIDSYNKKLIVFNLTINF